MRVKLGDLRSLVREAGKVSASPEYLRRERVRQAIQDALVEAVVSGDIKDDKGLKEFFATVDMATKALKVVPLEAWEKLASKK